MTRILRFAAAVTAAGLVAVSGCGGSGSAPAGRSAPRGNAVTIKSFSFKPKTLSVPVGTTVTWTNKDGTPHTVTATAGGGFDSGDLGDGKTHSMTFHTAGTFNYMCSIHPTMHGTVTVH